MCLSAGVSLCWCVCLLVSLLVCLSVGMSVGVCHFSDFWYQGSFLCNLKHHKDGFFQKKILAKNGEKGVKNRQF